MAGAGSDELAVVEVHSFGERSDVITGSHGGRLRYKEGRAFLAS